MTIPSLYKRLDEDSFLDREPKWTLPSLAPMLGQPKTSLFIETLSRQTSFLTFPPRKKPQYFHATKLENVCGILRDREISLPRKGSIVSGVYVSTLPEPTFGDYVLIFNAKITEGRPAPVKTDCWQKSRCWIEMGCPIPVNADTLEAVAVSKEAKISLEEASALFSECAGREIKAIRLF